MASKLLAGLVGGALIAAPTVAAAQATPPPAPEMSAPADSSSMFGENGLAIAGGFFSILVLLVAFQDDIFGDDDGDLNGPVSP